MRKMNPRTRSGFTLVELMVVAIIVAILAAVAIPLMSGNKKRAMATEAESALGTLRTQLRVMYAETGTYATNNNGAQVTTVWQIPGVNMSDLDGKYWETNAYSFVSAPSNTTYQLRASGNATGCDPALGGVTITLNQDGVFNRTGL
jgi:prepilin-type N-terminal cleavage/methylation domain-containing protein